jgi:DNA-binding LytR/AlgR family response regulator
MACCRRAKWPCRNSVKWILSSTIATPKMEIVTITSSIRKSVNTGDAYLRTERQVSELANQQSRERLTLAFRQSPASLSNSQSERSLRSQPRKLWSSTRIAMKSNGTILLVDPTEILTAEAQGNYVLVFHSKGAHLLREQISNLANRLHPYGLIRVHRSILVNAAHVESIMPLVTGEYLLRIRDGREYNVTRTYKKNLQALAAIWIGVEGFDPDSLSDWTTQIRTR